MVNLLGSVVLGWTCVFESLLGYFSITSTESCSCIINLICSSRIVVLCIEECILSIKTYIHIRSITRIVIKFYTEVAILLRKPNSCKTKDYSVDYLSGFKLDLYVYIRVTLL